MKLANKDTITVVLRGKASYAKIIGDPRLNFSKDGKEWSMDLQLSKAGVADCKNWGISSKIKQKDNYLDGAPHIRFKRDEFSKFPADDGSMKRNDPVPIVDITGKPWDGRLIGNGSVLDVQFRIKNYGVGKPTGVYIQKVRVMELVPFENTADLPPVSEDDEFFGKYAEAEAEVIGRKEAEDKQFKQDFGIDDDLDDPVD